MPVADDGVIDQPGAVIEGCPKVDRDRTALAIEDDRGMWGGQVDEAEDRPITGRCFISDRAELSQSRGIASADLVADDVPAGKREQIGGGRRADEGELELVQL